MSSKLTIEAVEDHTPNQSFREAGGGLQVIFEYSDSEHGQGITVGGPKHQGGSRRLPADQDFGKVDWQPRIPDSVHYFNVRVIPKLGREYFPPQELMRIPADRLHSHHYKLKIIVKEFSPESMTVKVSILGGPEDV